MLNYRNKDNLFRIDAARRFLKEFDNHARSINIDYCMVGGTLLGCIRHGTFMAWDDDIDLLMSEDDLKRMWDVFSLRYDHAEIIRSWPDDYFEWFVKFKKEEVIIDVWPYRMSKDGENMETFIGKLPLKKAFPYKTIDFEGSMYSIPNDPNYFLDRVFPHWRDTVVKRIDGHEGNLVSTESFSGPIRHQF